MEPNAKGETTEVEMVLVSKPAVIPWMNDVEDFICTEAYS
jgi:hypothetical protein